MAHIRPFRVDSISPQTSFPGGTQTITGSGFNAITKVWYYSPYAPQNPTSDGEVENDIDFQVQSDTQMTITVPHNATDDAGFYADFPGYSVPLGTFHMPAASACACLHLVSALPGNRTLDAQPSTTNTVVTNNNPHLGVWNYVFPTNSDQTHGLFQLVARNTGNQCLTEQDSTNLDRTAAPNLQRTTCSTDRGSDLYMRQLWYFVKGTDTVTNSTFELVSAADGRCADASADQDNANVNTTGCTAATSQQWQVLDPDDVLFSDAIPHGTILATDLANAKTTMAVDHRAFIYSAMNARRPLQMHDDLNSPWYPPTIDAANTLGRWAFGTESASDTQNGRFTLVDERHGRNRCLTETPQAYPSTPNNTQTAYNNLLMQACIEVPGSSTEARQHYTLRQVSATKFQIRSANDNRCLTVPYDADFNNSQVDIEPCGNQYGQLWTFDDTTGDTVAGVAAFNSDRDLILHPKEHSDESLGFYTDAKNAKFPPAFSPFPDPSGSKGGVSAPTDPNLGPPNVQSDPIEGKYIPYTMKTDTASFNHVFTLKYFSGDERTGGYFELVDKGNGLCLTNMFDFVGAVREDTCATDSGSTTESEQQWFFTIPLEGEVWLRSKQDGKCLALNGGGNDKFREVAMVQCHVNNSPDDAVWSITDADPTDAIPAAQGFSATDPNAAIEAGYALADGLATREKTWVLQKANANHWASTIRFCNHGAFAAEGVIGLYRTWTLDGANKSIEEYGPYSTDVLSVGDCQTYHLPIGQGITALISLHEFDQYYLGQYEWMYHPGLNGTQKRNVFNSDTYDDHPITEIALAAPYTNTTFNMYGTTCNPYYTVDSSFDTLSAAGTGLAEEDYPQGCGGGENGAFGVALSEAGEDFEDLTDEVGEFFQEIYPIMAGLKGLSPTQLPGAPALRGTWELLSG